MTQEEKARAYDAALERMKSWARGEHPKYFSEAQKTAEFIFPELKESEGEKMRKNLYKCLRYYVPNDIAEEYIAWLEKQGKKLDADKVIDWLRFHIQVDDPKIEYNEEGQPLAESFLAHAEERCAAADEVVNKFRQDFGL